MIFTLFLFVLQSSGEDRPCIILLQPPGNYDHYLTISDCGEIATQTYPPLKQCLPPPEPKKPPKHNAEFINYQAAWARRDQKKPKGIKLSN